MKSMYFWLNLTVEWLHLTDCQVCVQWRTPDFADVYAYFILCVLGGKGGGVGCYTQKRGQGRIRTAFCAYF